MRVEVVPWIFVVNGVERSRLKKVPQIMGGGEWVGFRPRIV